MPFGRNEHAADSFCAEELEYAFVRVAMMGSTQPNHFERFSVIGVVSFSAPSTKHTRLAHDGAVTQAALKNLVSGAHQFSIGLLVHD